MITAEHPLVKVGLIGAAAWSSAVQHLRADAPPVDDEMTTLQWEAAGLVDADGAVDPEWARAIRVTQDAIVGAEVVSVYQEMAFAATLLRHEQTLVCVTARGAIEGRKITAVHPMLEVAMAPSELGWELLRRVLPPLKELRADPRPTRPGDIELLTLDGVEIPESMRASQQSFATHLSDLPTLPTAMADALDPEASVFVYLLNAEGAHVRQSSQAWALGRLGLYRVDSDTAAIAKVPAGDLAHRILVEL